MFITNICIPHSHNLSQCAHSQNQAAIYDKLDKLNFKYFFYINITLKIVTKSTKLQ